LNTKDFESFSGCQIFDFSLFPHADRIGLFTASILIEERIQAFEKSSGEQVLRLANDEFEIIKIK